MLRSYVGLAEPNGLKSLFRESERARQVLVDLALRQASRRVVCFWAVAQEEVADQVQAEIELGFAAEALKDLQQFSRDLGPLVTSPIRRNTL
jgi:hypothetical protein